MAVCLYANSNRAMMIALIRACQQAYPSMQFALRDMGSVGWQLQLFGNVLDDAPTTFVNGFVASWKMREVVLNQYL